MFCSYVVGIVGDMYMLLFGYGVLVLGFVGFMLLGGWYVGLVGGGYFEDGFVGSISFMYNYVVFFS